MRICKFEGCGVERLSRDYCPGHHWQLKHGLELRTIVRMTSVERFWSYVTKSDGCWVWSGPKNQDGYGRFTVAGKKVFAHRFSYKLLVGEIPPGMELDHSCRLRVCCNPKHLYPVTRKQNVENIDVLRTSKTGIRGVGRSGNKFRARVTHQGKCLYLGLFDTAQEAGDAARSKRLELHTNNLLDRNAS